MTDTHRPSISAFFPCYNDKGTIGKMAEDAALVLKDLTDDFEVIVIDDGSTDGSRELLKELQSRCDFLKLVFHEKNQGYGGALKSGFRAASKDLVFYTDGDGQYDVWELLLLYNLMTAEADIVNGFKLKRSDLWYRKVIGRIYHWAMKFTFNLHIRDVDCDFRLLRRKIFDKVNLTRNSGVICVEMIRKIEQAGFKFAEVGVHHYPRIYGKSQFFNLRKLLEVFLNLFNLWIELVLRPWVGKKDNNYDEENKS